MNNLDDIFDLGDNEELKIKKPRKKPEMSDDKKAAMLERLAKGREVRAMKLKEKKGAVSKSNDIPNTQSVVKEQKEVKEHKEIKEPKEVKELIKPSMTDDHEKERIAFINNLMGKAKQNDIKYERPKKKIQAPPKDTEKPTIVIPTQKEPVTQPVAPVVAPVAQPVAIAPVAPVVRAPIIISNFKKAPWA